MLAQIAKLEAAATLTDAEFFTLWDLRIEVAARKRNNDAEVERLMLAQGDAIVARFPL